MAESRDPLLGWCLATLDALMAGRPGPPGPPAATGAESVDLAPLVERLVGLSGDWTEFHAFAEALAVGDLTATAGRHNALAAPLKSLQASLRHLTWQTQRVAEGDLSHAVDFMGDHAAAFNKLITALRAKQALERQLQEANAELDQRVLERTRQLHERNNMLHDEIVERCEVERELRAARRRAEAASQAKSDFLANTSHELRTPLNSVIGISDLMLGDPGLSEQHLEMVEIMNTGGNHLLRVVNDILDYSALEAGKLEIEDEEFAICPLVGSTLDMVRESAEDKGLVLRHHCAAELPPVVRGDPDRIRQILLNLLGNAVKFTAAGGVELDVKVVGGGVGTSRLRFEVTDTGPGIATEAQIDIFDRFTQVDSTSTRAHGGTGLGLSISSLLVDLMGGDIGLRSAPGEGSMFWFELPLEIAVPDPVVETMRASGAPAVPDIVPDRKPSVLLVDDNVTNLLVAELMLQQSGCDVCAVGSGTEAVAAVGDRAFDIVFMDCQMPEVDGWMATEAIRSLPVDHSDLPIVALTARARAEDRQRCLDSGMNDFMAKPVTAAAVVEMLERWTTVTCA